MSHKNCFYFHAWFVRDKIVQRYLVAATKVNFRDIKEYLEDEEDLKTFAKAVKLVAKKAEVKKFHDRAFIHSVKEVGFPRSDRQEWNNKLVAAHVAGFLELTRADLVRAMDRKDIDDSEIDYGAGATFNFVRLGPLF